MKAPLLSPKKKKKKKKLNCHTQVYLIDASQSRLFKKLDRSPSSPYSKMALKGSSSTIAIILAILTSRISAKVCMSFIKSFLKYIFYPGFLIYAERCATPRKFRVCTIQSNPYLKHIRQESITTLNKIQ
ncbi:hypothetical protein PUN28_019388 [Cardiocondyla obscurior]|uniref:Uncharacterized protein n=1 Tax=Cardiocondyla obscurior TaxID=286306 RepID=A0AAW2EF60_9HYME